VELLLSSASAFKPFALECSLFPRPAGNWRPLILWLNPVCGWRVGAFNVGYLVGLAEVLEKRLRKINEE
jgi:hypothetical protein